MKKGGLGSPPFFCRNIRYSMRLHSKNAKMMKLERPIFICAALLLIVSASAFLPTNNLIIDLLSHFRFQYFGAAIIGFVTCLLIMCMGTRAKWATNMFLGAAVINGLVLWSYLPTGGPQASTRGSFKVAVANILTANRDHNAVLSFARKENPDLLVLIETNDRWVQAMSPLNEIYPYKLFVSRAQHFGMMVFSKNSIKAAETRYFLKNQNIPSLLFELSIKGQTYHIAAIHALPPVGIERLRLRTAHLQAVANWVSSRPGPTLVAGDLNTTPFSHAYKQFLETAGLNDPRKNRGFLPTWGPFSPSQLRIPIDHILPTSGLDITSLTVGPDIGSDHRPLVAVIKPTSPPQIQK